MCLGINAASADIPLSYYSSLDGKCGQELKNAIHNLVSDNVSMLSYGSGSNHTWWGFYMTDYQMDGSQRQVVDRYSNDIRYFGSRGSSVSGMNIEHSFPKSWWGGTTNNAYKDLYNLMPSEKSINSSKSNYGMGVVSNVKTDNGCTKVGTGNGGTYLWEPADKWKGDFARAYLYMATCYQDFTWTGEALNSLTNSDWRSFQKWAYTLYIKWAMEDAVDQMEIDRNQAVSEIQGNRNPYVDLPNLMCYVWGDSISDPLNLATTVKAGDVITGGDIGGQDVTVYDVSFLNNNGGCTAEGTPGIWVVTEKYGWKGSGYRNGACTVADATISTPDLDLKNLGSATMQFSHAANQFNGGVPENYCSVLISVDGGTADLLTVQLWPAGNDWTFISSGSIDLTPYVGHTVNIKFRYTSDTSHAGTWEIKSLTVKGKAISGVENIVVDDDASENAPVEYYSIDGRRLDASSAHGIVIMRRGNKVSKVLIP